MQEFLPLTINRKASGAIAAYRFCAPTTTDGLVTQANATSPAITGVSDQLGAADGKALDVTYGGCAPVQYGGTVANGDPLTADANGKAVKALPGQAVAGYAMEKGVVDEIGSVMLGARATPAFQKKEDNDLTLGVCEIATDITVTADTLVVTQMEGAVGTTTNFAYLSHDKADNVVGGPGVGKVVLKARTAAGVADTDATGRFTAFLYG